MYTVGHDDVNKWPKRDRDSRCNEETILFPSNQDTNWKGKRRGDVIANRFGY